MKFLLSSEEKFFPAFFHLTKETSPFYRLKKVIYLLKQNKIKYYKIGDKVKKGIILDSPFFQTNTKTKKKKKKKKLF